MTTEPLTDAQREAIEFWNGYGVPLNWFAGATRDDGAREFIALGGGTDDEDGFAWSILVDADGEVHTSEAKVGPWETGVTI